MLTGDGEQDGRRMESVPVEKGTDQEKGALCAAHRKEGLLGSEEVSGGLPEKCGLRRGVRPSCRPYTEPVVLHWHPEKARKERVR